MQARHYVPSPLKQPSLAVVDVLEFLNMDLPHREMILSPWLPAQGLAMIYAPRGIGKTHVALGIAYAVTSNTTFLTWKPTQARSVLYLDGEMPAALMQERLLALAENNKSSLNAPFKLITPDLQNGSMPDLSTPKDQVMLEPYLAGVELIIVDNISTLCRNGRENEADSWLPVQEWALRMRASGKSVLFIHHAGKGGNQRGTSKREDILDTVISLKRPDDYRPKDGATFEVHFEKARGFFGKETEAFEAKFSVRPDGPQEWIITPVKETTYERIIFLAGKGLDQIQIAEKLNIHKSNVSRHLKRAHQEGRMG
jgi:DNA-binding CsgD family transcriptional regulator